MFFLRGEKKRSTDKLLAIGFVCLSFGLISDGHAREVFDATQTQVHLVDQPKRVVVLAPSLGELAADVLEGNLEKIVGVTEYTDFPEGLKKKTSVGPYFKFSFEKVVSLKPDLVLATFDGNSKDQINHLRELKIPTVVVKTDDFASIEDSMRLVAKSLGLPSKGDEIAKRFHTGIERIRTQSQSNSPVRVLLQLGEHPLIVAGGKSFLNSALNIIGAKNIYEGAVSSYPRPSIEDVVKKNPDVIGVIALGNDLKPFQEAAKDWNQFPKMKAVQTKQIYIIQSDSLIRPTLRLLDGLSLLEKTIYGKNQSQPIGTHHEKK